MSFKQALEYQLSNYFSAVFPLCHVCKVFTAAMCILVTVICDYLVIPFNCMINNCLLHMRQFTVPSILTLYQFVTKTPSAILLLVEISDSAGKQWRFLDIFGLFCLYIKRLENW